MSGDESHLGVESPALGNSDAEGKLPLTEERKRELYSMGLEPVLIYLRKNCKTNWSATDQKRVEYFKGLAAVKCLMKSGQFGIKRKQEAIILMERLLEAKEYFHAAQKGKTPSGADRLIPVHPDHQKFVPDQSRYIWTYDVPSWKNTILSVCLVVAVLAGCLFPMWPAPLRDGVWYLSMGCLGLVGLFFVVCILRLILFATVWVVTGGSVYLWWYPYLLRDDDKFWASFIPFYSIAYKQTGNKVAAKED